MTVTFQAFQTYDASGNQSVTKGEFRRVLESFCLPLTSDQFQGVVKKVSYPSTQAFNQPISFFIENYKIFSRSRKTQMLHYNI